MKILSIESSANVCGVALSENFNYLDSINEFGKHLHDKYLAQMVSDILQKNNLHLKDLNLISFNNGPGSFTGLRIAAALIKGLTFMSEIKIIPLNYFEIIYYNIIDKIDTSKIDNIVVVSLCNKDNYYFCNFNIKELNQKYEPKILSKGEIEMFLNHNTILTGQLNDEFQNYNVINDFNILTSEMQIIPSKYYLLDRKPITSNEIDILYLNELNF